MTKRRNWPGSGRVLAPEVKEKLREALLSTIITAEDRSMGRTELLDETMREIEELLA